MFTNSFAGIAPASAPLFVAAQIIGGLVGAALIVLIFAPVTSKE
jgi:arsenate reductase